MALSQVDRTPHFTNISHPLLCKRQNRPVCHEQHLEVHDVKRAVLDQGHVEEVKAGVRT